MKPGMIVKISKRYRRNAAVLWQSFRVLRLLPNGDVALLGLTDGVNCVEHPNKLVIIGLP